MSRLVGARYANLMTITGRTLEETATIFDGVNERLELQQASTVAATQYLTDLREDGALSTSPRRITFIPRLEA